jgi:hypothetical protein
VPFIPSAPATAPARAPRATPAPAGPAPATPLPAATTRATALPTATTRAVAPLPSSQPAPPTPLTPPRHAVATPRLPTSSDHLLALARDGLDEAAAAGSPAERYAAAHLSALRSAAAVIGARARPAPPPTRRTRPLSAWVLLATVAPELGEWAAFFAAGARKRAAADARIPGAVTAREADDLLRDAETFLAVAETKLGAQPVLHLLHRGVG